MHLAPEGHRDLLATSAISRLPLGMAGVGILTVAVGSGLGAGVGGTAVAIYSVAFAVAGPIWGRRAGNSGSAGVVLVCWLGQALACGLVLVGRARPWVFLAAALMWGLTTAPVVAIFRATWSRLLIGNPADSQRMAVVETLNSEAAHIIGRLLVALLAALGSAWIPVVSLVLTSLGAVRMIPDRRLVGPERVGSDERRPGPLWSLPTICWAGVLAAMSLSHGVAATTMVAGAGGTWRGAALMSVWGMGSLVGGLIALRQRQLRNPVASACRGALWFAGAALALAATRDVSGAVLLTGLTFVLGLPIAPAVSAVYRGVAPWIAEGRDVELLAQLTAVTFIAFAAGAACAGWLLEVSPAAVLGYAAAAAMSLLALIPLGPLVRVYQRQPDVL